MTVPLCHNNRSHSTQFDGNFIPPGLLNKKFFQRTDTEKTVYFKNKQGFKANKTNCVEGFFQLSDCIQGGSKIFLYSREHKNTGS